jgi:hypothetical protein
MMNILWKTTCDSSPIHDFNIQLVTDTLPRFSCACHKTNLVNIKLNKFASRSHRSIHLSAIFHDLKSRSRCETLTRWCSSFIMLWSFYKAYKNNCFTDKIK